tara:strand:+ start:4693 stop:4959 length:267 start_codon:yes stop_codon:yes gene_type:complete
LRTLFRALFLSLPDLPAFKRVGDSFTLFSRREFRQDVEEIVDLNHGGEHIGGPHLSGFTVLPLTLAGFELNVSQGRVAQRVVRRENFY